MVPDGMTYVATRDLWYNDVRMATAGQRVHESAVIGPDAWLTEGDGVERDAPGPRQRPADGAPHAAWVTYLTSRGLSAKDADAMSVTELAGAADGMDAEQAGQDDAAAGRVKVKPASGGAGGAGGGAGG